tara:strand:- start:8202 stop:8630 length:429 start_codon:yes stop_codon:yes gene_type:complete
MEEEVSHLFTSILTIIRKYEKINIDTISDKEKRILTLEELKERQELEMADFLKVSFASKWKKEAEETKKQNIRLQQKNEDLKRTNEELNFKLDKSTELIDNCTQTDMLNFKIQTQKGGLYIFDGNVLKSIKNNEEKIVGECI